MLKLGPGIALTGGEIFQIRYRFQRCNILDLGAVENERNPSENMPLRSMFFKNFATEFGWPNLEARRRLEPFAGLGCEALSDLSFSHEMWICFDDSASFCAQNTCVNLSRVIRKRSEHILKILKFSIFVGVNFGRRSVECAGQ